MNDVPRKAARNRRNVDRELADILATFGGDRINELREWARLLDEDYESSLTDGGEKAP
ncbi:MAG: hypothetical protein WCP29_15525 [Acidobacteriota bacterium]